MLTYTDRVLVSDVELAELLRFACVVAREAGQLTLQFFRRPHQVDNKLDDGRFDPVTEGDRAAEGALRRRIAERYPAYGVMGEEYGFQEGCGLTWVIDPIDGTRAFMSGMVHWGLLLALFDGQEPILGVMYQPFTDELWFGDGRAAFYRRGSAADLIIRTRDTNSLADAVLGTTNPNLIAAGDDRMRFDRLEKLVRLTRYGGDCYVYAVVAMGFMDLGLDGGLQSYDVQALVPIIRGAGGVITSWAGGSPVMGGNVLASANPVLHDRALSVLGG